MKKLIPFQSIFFISLIVLTVLVFQNLYSQIWWEESNSGVTVSLNSVFNINAHNAWICGDSGTVLLTTNNGYNWSNVSGGGLPANIMLVNIYALSSTTAITAGYTGSNTYVYKTSNTGGTWTQVFSQSNGFINAICMTSNTEGFMQGNPVGGRWSLWKTTNGGANWDSTGLYLPQAGSETGWRNSLNVVNNKIWFGTNNSHIYYSSNSGSNWIVQPTSPEVNTYTVWLDTVSSNFGYAGGALLLKTVNGGTNWTIDNTAIGTGNIMGFVGIEEVYYLFWYIRNNNVYNNFGGSSWHLEYTSPTGNYNHISISEAPIYFGPGFLYAVRDNGGLSRGNFWVEGITLISNEIPSAYKLHQNYPNPFNSSTKIKFDSRILPYAKTGEMRGGHVMLSVYNLLGQEIDVIVNKVVQPGIYEADWNGNNYPSGIYFYRLLITDPNSSGIIFNEIRKMVMIK